MKESRYITRLLLTILIVVAFALSAMGQTKQIQQLSADFTQTKTLKLLSEKMVSQGKMYYSGGNKLRWEYTQPYQYAFILNGSKVLLKHPNRTDVIDVNQNKIFKEIARIMMSTVVGSAIKESKDFDVTIYKGGQKVQEPQAGTTVQLIPKRKDLKAMFTKIILHIGENEIVNKVELLEKGGDSTLIELKNIKINEPIAEKIFADR